MTTSRISAPRQREIPFRRIRWLPTVVALGLMIAPPPAPADESATSGVDGAETEVAAELVETPVPPPEIQLRGEVVETACYLIGGRHGEKHKQCAIACARAGESLGIRDEESGLLYLGVVDRREAATSDPLIPYIAQRVDVRGEPLDYGDLPALIVREVTPVNASR